MSDWALIIYCGLITFLTRFSMIALLKKEMFNDRIREVLSYVPSAIFPAIIFPAIFLDNNGLILLTLFSATNGISIFGFPEICMIIFPNLSPAMIGAEIGFSYSIVDLIVLIWSKERV